MDNNPQPVSNQQAEPSTNTQDSTEASSSFSVPALQELVAQRTQDKGPRHPNTLEAMLDLELAERFSGTPENALAILDQVFKIRQEDLGPEHRDTLTCITKIAEVRDMLGQDPVSLQLQLEVLETRKRVLGELDLDTINSMEQLAIWYQNRAEAVPEEGGLAKAEGLFHSVLEANTKVLGPNDEETLASADRLAVVLRMQERFDEAETLQMDTVERSKTYLGKEHDGTVAAVEELELMRSLRSKSMATSAARPPQPFDRSNRANMCYPTNTSRK